MHFSVMVFGDDVGQLLAPFQEPNMGPIAPEYLEKIDVTRQGTRAVSRAPKLWPVG